MFLLPIATVLSPSPMFYASVHSPIYETGQPSQQPTIQPSLQPTMQPTQSPTGIPLIKVCKHPNNVLSILLSL